MIRSTSTLVIRAAFFAFGLSIAIPAVAIAQGATGGSLGNDNKSLSGARDEPRATTPMRRERAERREAPRREPRRSGGGGFDGAWIVTAVGLTCSGSSRNAVIVTSGRIMGNNVTSGTVSASGAVNATGGSNGLTNVTTGRLSGRGGGGTFRQSDGCTGRWTASKQ